MKQTFPLLVFVAVTLFPGVVGESSSASETLPQAVDQIPANFFQYRISLHYELREGIDFLTAPPELIQQALNRRRVIVYDQN
ncbi:MAG: hypothetical protein KDA96_09595 [Planctomycetaceae bacterium]|nr:hypothetical protein [Planctomycetaceae bacterium]